MTSPHPEPRAHEEGRYPPIADYGFLGDCHNWALVSRRGSIDWCCFERAGGHTAFARILDWDKGGSFRVAPSTHASVSRHYLPDTNVLVTRSETGDGILEVTDALLVTAEDDDAPDGISVRPSEQLLRLVRCRAGRIEVDVDFRPRFDYGLTSTHVRVREGHLATVLGGGDALLLHSEIPLEQRGWQACGARVSLTEGDERYLVVSYHASHELELSPFDRERTRERLDGTVEFWRGWASRSLYDGAYRDHVARSALVLKALTDARTGAIIAAPTTSLPEEVGGERNWDYRFTWLRDSAWHVNALFGLGYEAEAHAFMRWLARATAGTAGDVQVMYGNTGRRLISEVTLRGLEGYRGSRPVRVGNRAVEQFQLDIYGELVSAVWHYYRHGGDLSPEMRHLLPDVLDLLQRRWQEPDRGIWEVRGTPEEFVSSKLYVWVAADRMLRLADDGVIDIDVDGCKRLREEVQQAIDHYGVDTDEGYFLRSFGRPGVDAANLLTVLEGYVDPHDPRVDATVARVHAELAGGQGDLIHRYRTDDGLSGQQGAFFWSSFWMVSVHVARGELDRARQLFESLLERTNDLGLLSEEVNGDTGDLLGNFPQVISHVGLIDAALRLYEAEHGHEATGRVMPR